MSCTDQRTEIRGWYMWIRECATQAGVFWRVLCDGPIEWTTPLFDLTGDFNLAGDQRVDGYIELLPIPAPNPPSTGCRLFIDEADNKLKVKFASGVVKIIEEP